MTEKKTTTVAEALLAARQEFPAVIKDATNPHYKNTYASLGAVLAALEPVLAAHGLLLLQTPGLIGGTGDLVLTTEIIHVQSGSTIESEYPVRPAAPNDPQKLAAALTYARRNAILCICGVAPEDDDGQQASTPAPQRQEVDVGDKARRMVKTAEKLDQQHLIKDYAAYVDIIKVLAQEYGVNAVQVADACELPAYGAWTLADFPKIIGYFDTLAADRRIEAATHKRKGKK